MFLVSGISAYGLSNILPMSRQSVLRMDKCYLVYNYEAVSAFSVNQHGLSSTYRLQPTFRPLTTTTEHVCNFTIQHWLYLPKKHIKSLDSSLVILNIHVVRINCWWLVQLLVDFCNLYSITKYLTENLKMYYCFSHSHTATTKTHNYWLPLH